MNIRFLFTNTPHDEKIKVYVREKIEKLKKYVNCNIIVADAEIERDKRGKHRVEIMLKTPYQIYRGEETAKTPQAAADLVEEELKVQLCRSREKIKTLRKRGARSIRKKFSIDSKARFR